MINFENGKTPLNDANLNQMQIDLQLDIGVSNGNIDEINKTEFRYTSDIERTPNGANGYLFTQRMDDDYILQEFNSYNASDKWVRAKTAGIWRDWKRIVGIVTTTLQLSDGWEAHDGLQPQIVKNGAMVHIALIVESGTGTLIGILPEGFRPKSTMFVPTSKYNGYGSQAKISTDGAIRCETKDVGSLITINATLLVE